MGHFFFHRESITQKTRRVTFASRLSASKPIPRPTCAGLVIESQGFLFGAGWLKKAASNSSSLMRCAGLPRSPTSVPSPTIPRWSKWAGAVWRLSWRRFETQVCSVIGKSFCVGGFGLAPRNVRRSTRQGTFDAGAPALLCGGPARAVDAAALWKPSCHQDLRAGESGRAGVGADG